MKTFRLTYSDAQEVLHKMCILADEPDLQADYSLTPEQATALRDSVPPGGGDWAVADALLPVVRGEMLDHAQLTRNIAEDARSSGETGQALAAHKQAARFERMFGDYGAGKPQN